MTIDQLKVFIAVYKSGSFSIAAKEKNISSSNISRSISALEKSVQVRLFQRNTRKVSPTQEGILFYQRIETILDELDHAQQELTNHKVKPSGHLRITASSSFGQMILAPKLQIFRKHYPEITLDLVLSDQKLDLIDQQIDIAFRHGVLEDNSLVARKIMSVNYHVVASPNYLENHTSLNHPSDICKHDISTFNYKSFNHLWCFKKENTIEEVAFSPTMTVSNALALRECARSGCGLSLLPDWCLDEDYKNGTLKRLFTNWDVGTGTLKSAIWLVLPSRKLRPAKVTAFIEYFLGSVNNNL